MLTLAPWLIAMAVLLALSAFFSASEAALFSLRISEQTRMRQGSPGEKLAATLLADADLSLIHI